MRSRAEMKNAGADWQVIVYGGAKHSFTNPNSDSIANARYRLQQTR